MSGECVIWNGSINNGGLGYLCMNGKQMQARRAALLKAGRKIPRGRYTEVTCGIKLCVNPDHIKVSHGRTHSPTYVSWACMITRCTNPKIDAWMTYGGRGIKVCDRWRKFENFYADMGKRPRGKSIDRIDSNGNYEPGNCRWATLEQQLENRRARVWKKPVTDIVGQRFGKFTVVKFSHVDKNRESRWVCVCDCGEEKIKSKSGLLVASSRTYKCLRSQP